MFDQSSLNNYGTMTVNGNVNVGAYGYTCNSAWEDGEGPHAGTMEITKDGTVRLYAADLENFREGDAEAILTVDGKLELAGVIIRDSDGKAGYVSYLWNDGRVAVGATGSVTAQGDIVNGGQWEQNGSLKLECARDGDGKAVYDGSFGVLYSDGGRYRQGDGASLTNESEDGFFYVKVTEDGNGQVSRPAETFDDIFLFVALASSEDGLHSAAAAGFGECVLRGDEALVIEGGEPIAIDRLFLYVPLTLTGGAQLTVNELLHNNAAIYIGSDNALVIGPGGTLENEGTLTVGSGAAFSTEGWTLTGNPIENEPAG